MGVWTCPGICGLLRVGFECAKVLASQGVLLSDIETWRTFECKASGPAQPTYKLRLTTDTMTPFVSYLHLSWWHSGASLPSLARARMRCRNGERGLLCDGSCPACFAAPKERHRIKMLLSEQDLEEL